MQRGTLTVVPERAVDALPVLTSAAARAAQERGICVLDVRHHTDFAAAHLPGSLNVGLDERFAATCRDLVPAGVEVVLAGVGDAVPAGLLDHAGLRAAGVVRPDPSWSGRSWRLDEMPSGPVQVVDVRAARHAADHPGAVRIALGELVCRLGELRPDGPTAVLDDDGYRASAAASLLRACGFAQVGELAAGSVRPRLRLLASA